MWGLDITCFLSEQYYNLLLIPSNTVEAVIVDSESIIPEPTIVPY
jgi:hypothetical protein